MYAKAYGVARVADSVALPVPARFEVNAESSPGTNVGALMLQELTEDRHISTAGCPYPFDSGATGSWGTFDQ